MRLRLFIVVLSTLLLGAACQKPASPGKTNIATVNSTVNVAAQNINTNARTCTPTAQLTAGPYYKTGSPERQEIRKATTSGFTITLHGQVLDTNCQPIAGAVLDFWQADGQGNYDNNGYELRGYQTTNANGEYTLYTVIPGRYPGRTEHIHVKVRRPDGQFITTQLFFPLSAGNSTDTIFDQSLVVEHFADENLATYDFILR